VAEKFETIARDIAHRASKMNPDAVIGDLDPNKPVTYVDAVSSLIAEALRQVERETLERAATYLESWYERSGLTPYQQYARDEFRAAARGLRNLELSRDTVCPRCQGSGEPTRGCSDLATRCENCNGTGRIK